MSHNSRSDSGTNWVLVCVLTMVMFAAVVLLRYIDPISAVLPTEPEETPVYSGRATQAQRAVPPEPKMFVYREKRIMTVGKIDTLLISLGITKNDFRTKDEPPKVELEIVSRDTTAVKSQTLGTLIKNGVFYQVIVLTSLRSGRTEVLVTHPKFKEFGMVIEVVITKPMSRA
jgi:hypothetical protein